MKKRASDGLKPVFEMLNSRFSVVKIFRTEARQPSWREQDRPGRADRTGRRDGAGRAGANRTDKGRTDRTGRAGKTGRTGSAPAELARTGQTGKPGTPGTPGGEATAYCPESVG